MFLKFLKKQKGGRLQHVATFENACHTQHDGADAQWIMTTTLQSHDEAADEAFSHVGITDILKQPCVVKLMEQGKMADKEVAAQKWFSAHPHVNIIQGICTFTCNDNPVRWKSRQTRPQAFCNETNGHPFVVVIQEYIVAGDLTKINTWTLPLWKSIVLQLTYACMEWYEQGFLFGDWHYGNILLDTSSTPDHVQSYTALGSTFKVQTHGVCPVITDFGRCTLMTSNPESFDVWMLSDQISTVWDMFKHTIPYDVPMRDFVVKMGAVDNHNDLIALVKQFRRLLILI